MMHYSKGENVEKEITKSDLPFEDCLPKEKDFLWMKVRGGTKVNNVISHAKNALEKGEHRTLIWTGAGGGLVKTVSCAEIIKRSFPLYQLTRMCYTSTEEHWKPQLEGLEEIVANRQIPCLHILMSLDRIDVKGVQEPNTTTEFWSEDLISPSTSRRPDNNEHRQQQPQQKEETKAGSSQKKRNRSRRQKQQSQQGSQQSRDQQNDHQRPQNQQPEVKKSQQQPQRPQDQQKKIKQQQRPQHPQSQQQQQSGQPLQKNKPQKQQQQNQQQQQTQNKDKLCQSTSQGQKQPKTREQPQQRSKKPKEARTEAADPAPMEI